MAEDITIYKGLHPTVLKKVEPTDYKVNPFQANKTFEFDSGSAYGNDYKPLQAIYVSGLPAISSSKTFNDAVNVDGSYKFSIYNSINQLFYKRKTEPGKTHGPTDLNKTSKHLFLSASVFSIPQIKFGEGIKPGSFQYNGTRTLRSDLYGNIYDSNIVTGSFPGGEKFYEGFNEYFDTSRIPYTNIAGVTYVDGVPTSNGSQLPIGLAASFSGSGFIETNLSGIYDRYENYAISFFITGANSSNSDELVIGKLSQSISEQYPFKIELSGSNQIKFSAAGSNTFKAELTSSIAVTGSWTHVLCQKSGSDLQMYIDGTLESSGSFNLLNYNFNSPFTASAKINNDSTLKIGGYSTNNGSLHGDLDEIRIFNKYLTQAQISTLSDRTEGGGMLQTARVGNVFGKQGLVVISSPDYRYNDIINTAYTSSYKSTISLYEHSVLVRLDSGDFNVSQNPTVLTDNGYNIQSFATGSDFSPYITTIGLYNDLGQLLMIGKLATPIRKRNDVDMSFLINIDLDKSKIPTDLPVEEVVTQIEGISLSSSS